MNEGAKHKQNAEPRGEETMGKQEEMTRRRTDREGERKRTCKDEIKRRTDREGERKRTCKDEIKILQGNIDRANAAMYLMYKALLMLARTPPIDLLVDMRAKIERGVSRQEAYDSMLSTWQEIWQREEEKAKREDENVESVEPTGSTIEATTEAEALTEMGPEMTSTILLNTTEAEALTEMGPEMTSTILLKLKKKYWLDVLEKIVAVVKFLFRQCLAFQGSSKILFQHDNGNFLKAVEMISSFDPINIVSKMMQSVTIDIKVCQNYLKNLVDHFKNYRTGNFFEEVITQAAKLAADLEIEQDFPAIVSKMMQSVTIDIKVCQNYLKNLVDHFKNYRTGNFFEEVITQAAKLAADLEIEQDFPAIYTTRPKYKPKFFDCEHRDEAPQNPKTAFKVSTREVFSFAGYVVHIILLTFATEQTLKSSVNDS
ncbi:hypothetical protein QE152_g14435 [Popillia japonica]|uniref:Uncharacterized protein n=1 Tax=Popillia japonica TaxID=7064 RepID=A0AAW1L9F2_POPJA